MTADGALWTSLLLSLRVSLLATAGAAITGLPLAWILARWRFRGHRLLDLLVNLPLVLPPSVVGYYLLVLMGREGPLGRLAQWATGGPLVFTPAAAVVAAALLSLPLFVQAARNALEAVNPEVVEAARVDGANRWQVAARVVLPNAWPGIYTGLVLAYARSLGEFGATLMVAGNIPGKTQTLPLLIFTAVQAGQESLANQLAAILTAVGALSMWAALRWRRWEPRGFRG